MVTNPLEVRGDVSVLWNGAKSLTKSPFYFVIGRLQILP